MKFFATCWLSLVALFSFFASALAEFKWTKLPTEMTIGQTYELAWTGAVGPVTIYTKKDASASSWRAYVYGGGEYLGRLTWQWLTSKAMIPPSIGLSPKLWSPNELTSSPPGTMQAERTATTQNLSMFTQHRRR